MDWSIFTLSFEKLSKMTETATFRDIQVPVPGFGAMGLSFGLGSNLSLEEAEPVLLKAIELGCTFWDTAVSREPSNGYVGY
jgi:aryl-alcohol dehydrogenase-like predicted oxidoreductase